ncbi:MAG: DNA-directed RNA polymerase subunit omega [Oscillospiraceae bacterium]
MMIKPPVTELVDKAGSSYLLVMEIAKRARQITEGAMPLTICGSNKEVTIATNEIYEGLISYSSTSVSEEVKPNIDMFLNLSENHDSSKNELENPEPSIGSKDNDLIINVTPLTEN